VIEYQELSSLALSVGTRFLSIFVDTLQAKNGRTSRSGTRGRQKRQNLPGLGVAPDLGFAENRLPVHGDFEPAASRRNELDLRFRIPLLYLSRQTGGSGTVVSKGTVLDLYFHSWAPFWLDNMQQQYNYRDF